MSAYIFSERNCNGGSNKPANFSVAKTNEINKQMKFCGPKLLLAWLLQYKRASSHNVKMADEIMDGRLTGSASEPDDDYGLD